MIGSQEVSVTAGIEVKLNRCPSGTVTSQAALRIAWKKGWKRPLQGHFSRMFLRLCILAGLV